MTVPDPDSSGSAFDTARRAGVASAARMAGVSTPDPVAPPLLAPEVLGLLGKCISHLNDIVLITEAEPFDLPGPRIVFVNQAFERNTGYSPAEVIGATPRLFQGPDTDPAELRRIGAALRRWEIVRSEVVNYRKNGEPYWVEMEMVPVSDDTGRYTHWVSIQRDVTARKLAEGVARLHDRQRAESLGTLATGVAHDFNNIIAAILGNVKIAQRHVADGRGGGGALEQIHIAGLRARKLVQQILAYSRQQPQSFDAESLGAIVVEATDMLRASLPASVDLIVHVAAGTMIVEADATLIQQVLLNLGTNAWHALRSGAGRIEFECERVQTGAGGASDAVHPRDRRQFAVIRVRDNGGGMDARTRERIFEPYFTTKAIGQGTGLGLSVAWGILASHGATIEVESMVGVGSVFTIRFPLIAADADLPVPDAPVATPAVGQGQRVMLVDDDEVVLLMLDTVLTSVGFQVVPFSCPVTALAALQARPADFDIVVTDHNMPAKSGLELTAQLIAIAPELPVLITSGYVDAELSEAAVRAGAAEVFQKEFAAETLPHSVCRLLKRRAALTPTAKASVSPQSA